MERWTKPEKEDNFENLLNTTKEILGYEGMDENEVDEWLNSNDEELEMTDQENVKAVMNAVPDADDTE